MSGTCGCDSVACICEDIAAAEMIAERHDAEQRSLAAKLAAAESRSELAEARRMLAKTCEDCGNATCVCEGIGKMLTEAKCGTCGRDMNDAYNRLLCREHFTASIAALTSELAEARQMLKEQAAHTPALDALEKVGGDVMALGDKILKAELAEARRLADEWCRAWAELPSPEATDELRRELAEARRMLGEVCERGIMLEQAVSDLRRERDAYRDAKRLGPWMHNGERPWGAPGGTIEEWLRIGPAFVSVNYVRRADGTSEAWGQCPGMSASFRDGDEARAAIDAALISGSWWLEGGPHGAGEAK